MSRVLTQRFFKYNFTFYQHVGKLVFKVLNDSFNLMHYGMNYNTSIKINYDVTDLRHEMIYAYCLCFPSCTL